MLQVAVLGVAYGAVTSVHPPPGGSVTLVVTVVTLAATTGLVVYLRNRLGRAIGELLEANRVLEARIEQQRVAADLGRRALASGDVTPLVHEAVAEVARTLGAGLAAFWESSPSGEGLRLAVGYGRELMDLGQAIEAHAASPERLALRTGDRVIVDRAGRDSRLAGWDLAAAVGIESVLSVAVPGTPAPFGALSAYSTAAGRFGEDDARFLDAVGAVLAAAMSRSRAERERQQLERALYQAQKMEAIGRLIGGVAHDFNNILLAIKAEAWLLDSALAPDAEERELVRAIDSAAERASSLTRQLLAFSRQQPWQPELVDPSSVVAAVTEMLEPLIGEDVELTVDLDPEPGLARIDRAQLEQRWL